MENMFLQTQQNTEQNSIKKQYWTKQMTSNKQDYFINEHCKKQQFNQMSLSGRVFFFPAGLDLRHGEGAEAAPGGVCLFSSRFLWFLFKVYYINGTCSSCCMLLLYLS